MNNHTKLIVASLLIGFLGCGQMSVNNSTLVIHAHDDVYDFLNRDGTIIETAKDLEQFENVLKKPRIKNLIRGDRVVIRLKGVITDDGLSIPESLTPAIAKLAVAGVYRQDFEYTN